jgi:anaphase-promoting complex subunit 5
MSFEISLLHLDFLIRNRSYAEALSKIESLAKILKEHNADVYHRVQILTLKAIVLDKCGTPERGFSIAIRAASTAWRARILPALWFAMAAVANIVIHLQEFEAAKNILASIMPQVLECEDAARSAQVYSLLVDAHVGMAGMAKPDTLKRKEQLTKALEMLDCAFTGMYREDVLRSLADFPDRILSYRGHFRPVRDDGQESNTDASGWRQCSCQ